MEYFDLHCDTVNRCLKKAVSFKDTALKFFDDKISFKQKQCFALWIDDKYTYSEADEQRNKLFNKYKEIKYICKKNNIEPFLTLENSKGLKDVSLWKESGVVTASLTWNGENEFASGSSCKNGGLKEKGKDLIRQFNKERIVLDVSHLNFQSFFDVCSFTDEPFIASHSNCYSLCSHNRNLKDEQIKEIISRDGLIGICFYPHFLGKGDVFENIYRNICHIACLGGENNIGFGSDFDGAKMSDKLKSRADIVPLYEFLISKSLSEELVLKIFYKNSEKFFGNVLH